MIQFKSGLLLASTQMYQAEAEVHLKKALTLKPDFAYAESQLGRLYYLLGRDTEARQYLTLSNQHLPECATTLAYLAMVAERQEQLGPAYAYAVQALERSGKLHHESVDRGGMHLHVARLALKLNRPDDAERYAREALQYLDVSPSQVYQQLIAIPLAQNDFKRALTLFSEYQQRPGIQLTDADQALYRRIYLLQQLEAKPNDPALLNDLGGLALLTGQIQDAESYLNRALQLAPQNPAILFNQGLLKLQAKDYAQSIRIFEQVLQRDPHHRKAAFNLGQAQLKTGQTAVARQTWEQLLEAHPDDREALQALESL